MSGRAAQAPVPDVPVPLVEVLEVPDPVMVVVVATGVPGALGLCELPVLGWVVLPLLPELLPVVSGPVAPDGVAEPLTGWAVPVEAPLPGVAEFVPAPPPAIGVWLAPGTVMLDGFGLAAPGLTDAGGVTVARAFRPAGVFRRGWGATDTTVRIGTSLVAAACAETVPE
jgi:hypothetical protein